MQILIKDCQGVNLIASPKTSAISHLIENCQKKSQESENKIIKAKAKTVNRSSLPKSAITPRLLPLPARKTAEFKAQKGSKKLKNPAISFANTSKYSSI